MPPQKIGRYEVERFIPGGGMADVYLARDPNTDRQVVVKLIKREYSDNAEFRARFRQEAKTIARLDHAAIVTLYEFDEYEGQPFIAMRYMPGGSLLDRLHATGPLGIGEIARIIERVAGALDEAHELGIVHRDLKPGNILFDSKGNACLSDFGIAKKIAETTTSLSTTGFIGTPAYASPEQINAKVTLDGRADVYSLGIVVYELLTGKLPYNAVTPMGMALAHLNDPIPNVLAARPGLPRGCEAFIRKALTKDREKRYATAGELARELTRLAAETKTPAGSGIPNLLSDKLRRSFAPVDDLRPTVAEPETEPPAGSGLRPRRSMAQLIALARQWLTGGKLPCLAPVALFSIVGLVALFGAIALVPGLLAPRTPPATETSVVMVATTPLPTKTPTLLTQTATEIPVPNLGVGATQISQKDGMVLVFVPAGEFLMGSADSDTQASPEEKPQHTVFLDAFWIDQTEVTNAMYKLCVDDGNCESPSSNASETRNSYFGSRGFDNYPVINMSWYDALAYCGWAGRRLPTEAEWEKAARGDDGRIYPWGNDAPDANLLNFNNNLGDTAAVGSYPAGASFYGARDLAGNVWEWVNDWFDEGYYANSPAENPTGPERGDYKVLRGGSWYLVMSFARSAYRLVGVSYDRNTDIGFRCSLSP